MRAAIGPLMFAAVLANTALIAADPPTAKHTILVDRLGDPLPARATVRLGNIRYRGPVFPGPDGKTLLTMHGNRGAIIDPDTGAAIRYLPGPDQSQIEMQSLLLSDDAKTVVYCGAGQVQLWDVASQQCLRSVTVDVAGAGADEIRPIAIKNHLIFLTAGSWRPSALCCDMNIGKVLWTFQERGSSEHHLRILGLDSSASNLIIIQRNADKAKLQFLALESGNLMRELPIDVAVIAGTAGLSPDGHEIAAIDATGKAHRINVADGKTIISWKSGLRTEEAGNVAEHYASPFSYGAGGKKIVGADWSTVRIYDTANGKEITRGSRSIYYGSNSKPAFTKDGSTVWFRDGTAGAWKAIDATNGKVKRLPKYDGHTEMITSAAISPDGKQAITCDGESVLTWDTENGAMIRKSGGGRTIFGSSPPMWIGYSADGKTIAGMTTDGMGLRWDAATGKNLSKQNFSKNNPVLNAGLYGGNVAFNPTADRVATRAGAFNANAQSEEAPKVAIHDMLSGKEVATFPGAAGWKSNLEFSHDGRSLLVMATDFNSNSSANIHNTETGRVIMSLGDGVTVARLTAFGNNVAYIANNEIIVRELSSGQIRLRVPTPHDVSIDILAVSPEGRWLAAANSDGTPQKIFLWEMRRGTALDPLVGHDQQTTLLAFGPNGRLMSAAADQTALIWDVRDHKPAASPLPIPASEHTALWNSLAADAAIAHETIERLLEHGSVAVSLLRERIRPATPIERAAIVRLLAMTDAPRYQDRNQATTELERLDAQAEPHLRQMADIATSAEARARSQRLLSRLSGTVTDPDRLRELRATELLKRLGTPEACELLQYWSTGDPAARLTRAASQAIQEIQMRSTTPSAGPPKTAG